MTIKQALEEIVRVSPIDAVIIKTETKEEQYVRDSLEEYLEVLKDKYIVLASKVVYDPATMKRTAYLVCVPNIISETLD